MSVTVNTGIVGDQDILQNERVVEMDPVIRMLDPDVSQFTTMIMRQSRVEVFSSKVEWLEDQLFPRLSAVVSGGATDGASITVTTGQGSYFRPNDIVRNAHTGVAFRVTSIAGDVLSVSTALGAVAFAAHNASDQLLILGNASQQGATLGTRAITQRVRQYNYTQIFRNPYGFTNTLTASRLYGGPALDKERAKKAVEHKRGIEYAAFWGARALDTSGAEPIGFAGGLFETISTNVKNAGGSLTASLLDSYMRDFLQHTERNVVLFVSPVVAGAISGFLRDAWKPVTVDTRLFGAKVDGFISGTYGFSIPVVVKKDWNDFSTSSTQYGGWAFNVDLDYVEYAYLTGRDTKLLRDRQAPDADATDEEYLTECSFKVMQEQHHGLIKGVTG